MRIVNIVVLFILIISCNKNDSDLGIETTNPVIGNIIPKDSCFYTIDGRNFICDRVGMEGKFNKTANFNISTNTWDADSIMYGLNFKLSRDSYADEDKKSDGFISINFVKKYKKSSLIFSTQTNFASPQIETILYSIGSYKYATDFDRFNYKNGVAITVKNRFASYSELLHSYITASIYSPTSLGDNCQDNSTFEIVKYYTLPNGVRIVEAKFTANVFTQNEVIKRVENGYIRFSIIK